MARPKLNIDADLVEKMASWGCKNIDIADHFSCSEDTITNRFSDLLRKGRSNLKTNLRQWQLTSARNGNVAMLIWLGKQMLGQSDKIEEKNHSWIKQESSLSPEDRARLDKLVETIVNDSKA